MYNADRHLLWLRIERNDMSVGSGQWEFPQFYNQEDWRVLKQAEACLVLKFCRICGITFLNSVRI